MPTYALVDCNAFYCSCETLFQPWLRSKPVVVVSSNDGCVVSRNDHAKAMGIKMGEPLFHLKDLCQRGGLQVFSSNYALYQSLSNRVMAILEELSPRAFVYSIDESFCELTGIEDPMAWGQMAQQVIMERVGIPVGVGISTTKTLAKLANWAAKKWKRQSGCVVDLTDPHRQARLLKIAPIEEVWGIGARLSARLKDEYRIHTAWDLIQIDPKQLRRGFSVNLERTARELSGVACFSFEDGSPERKHQIICSRSFGQKLYTLDDLKQAVASFAANAAVKLRAQNSLAHCVQVYARTNGFKAPHFADSRVLVLPEPSSDTRDIVQVALQGLESLYQAGPAYAKAGVVLSQFVQQQGLVRDLFAPKPRANSEALMKVIDAINLRQGRGAVRLGREALPGKGQHAMQQNWLSPAYTTDWDCLPAVRC
jgi:DNA polymerase V